MAMGIKRKIITGFISIGSLLFLSGIISSGELLRLNRTTTDLLQRSRGNIELSKLMLDAVQEENTALLMSLSDTTSLSDSIISLHRETFHRALEQTLEMFNSNGLNTRDLDSIAASAERYNNIALAIPDTMNMAWFSDVYKTTYHNLTASIKSFMITTQNRIVDFATQIESNAYRASMVGIIALASGFMLIVLFYLLMNGFFIRPVLTIRQALKHYLERSIPYDATVATKDELGDLNDMIQQLVERSKQR